MIKDPNLRTITRQRRLAEPTNITGEVLSVAKELVHDNWNAAAPIRMLSVAVSGLVDYCGDQLSFFEDDEKKRRAQKLDAALDTIRQRYGKDAVQFGAVLNTDIKHKKDERR